MSNKSGFSEEFTLGFCLAIAEMFRNNSDSHSARSALDAAGYSLAEIKKCDVPDFDLKEIKEIYRETDK